MPDAKFWRVVFSTMASTRSHANKMFDLILFEKYVLMILVTILVATVLIRLSQCLPQFKTKRRKKLSSFNIRTMIVFGSGSNVYILFIHHLVTTDFVLTGGHTTEMLMLIQKLQWYRHGPVHCVMAQVNSVTHS